MPPHPALRVLFWLVILYAGYCTLLFVLQRRILFPRHFTKGEMETPKDSGIEVMRFPFSQGMGEAWYLHPVPEAKRPCPAVIFAHGNAERIDWCVPEMLPFRKMGIGVLLVEYPGYGRSPGAPSEKSITEAFVAAYDALLSRKDTDPSRIVFYGRSLGGGAVSALAARRPSAGIILASTFRSIRSFAGNYFVPSFLMRDAFDNEAVLRTYSGPVLIFHGTKDELIPHAHGKALAAAGKRTKLVSFDCGHNDCPPDDTVFWAEIRAFLHSIGI